MRRLPALDGLRGIAVLLVLLFHTHLPALNTAWWDVYGKLSVAVGWSGVDLFFVLSGFLITSLLLRARGSGAYFVPFYMRRVLRIFPLYYAFLAVALIALPVLFGVVLTDQPWIYWLYVSNYGGAAYGYDPALVHFWSLAVEEHFYLLWPALVAFTPRRWLGAAMLAVAGLSLGARFVHAWLDHSPTLAWIATHTRLDGLALGGLVAWWWPSARPAHVPAVAAAGLFGGMIALAVVGPAPGYWAEPFSRTFGYAFYACTYAGLLLATLAAQPTDLLPRALGAAPLQLLGKHSYAIYVLHLPLHELLRAGGLYPADIPALIGPSGPLALPMLAYDAAVIGLSTLGAVITWHLLEAPLLRLKRFFPYGGTADAPRESAVERA